MKGHSIEALLGPLEVERLKILFSPENQKIRSLSTSFFNMKIPLQSTSGKSELKAIVVKPLTSKSERIIIGLLWHAIFGRAFKVVHWHILFNVLIRTMKVDTVSRSLLSILVVLCTSRDGFSSWNMKMRSFKTTVRKHVGDGEHNKAVDKILKSLPYQLPKKGPIIDDLIKITMDGRIYQRKPRELARIGVGYKDKGSLRKGTSAELPIPDFYEKERIFEVLLRQVKADFPGILK